ncbi:hypothetical protein G9A89_021471 [Geosiphon pyriformis]|nr:hypothetical protein G9A89_021471 [Geosiphon pyriformis]
MKKSAKGFSADTISKDVAPKKKKKGWYSKRWCSLENSLSNKVVGGSWGFETGDTTEFDSVNIEKKFLVKKTSVDYGEKNFLEGKDNNQTLLPTLTTFKKRDQKSLITTSKGPKIVTKQALGKPLGKINFLGSDDDDILLDGPVVFLLPLKNLVNISVRKSFALNISLDNVVGKFTQEKLVVVRKLFSKINGFGGASILSKFAGIIRVSFTSDLSLVQASKKAENVKILVNTDLKKSTGHSNWAVVIKKILVGTSAEAVCAVLSEFNYIGSVGGKTCVIDCHPVTYAQARCAIVCFGSAESLDAIMDTTSVLKGVHLHWSCFSSTVYAECSKVSCRVLSDADKSKLVAIYAKHLVPVSCPVSFGGVSWANIVVGSSSHFLSVWNGLLNDGFFLEMKSIPQVSLELNDRFAALERSLASLAECVNKLAKRLDALEPTVSQLSPGCQPLVTPSLQNQRADIVMSKGSGVATSDGTVAGVVVVDSLVVSKLKEMLNNLSVMVMSLSARIDNAGLVPTTHFFQ